VDLQTIDYEVRDKIARITLNRPEKLNALSYRLRREFVAALKEAERDDEAHVILVSGRGRSFCAGYDITPDASGREGGNPEGWVESEHYDAWTDQFARSCLRDWMTIWDCLKPVVCKVHGHALAGGTELMSMCDIAFVADDTQIGYPPMRGMTTPDVMYFPWKLGMANAKYLQLTGNSVTGKEAAEMGWVAKSFPAAELDEAVEHEVRALAAISPDLAAANKASLNQAYEIMGMRNHLQNGWSWHALSSRLRPGGGDFGRISQDKGLKAALAWRDGPAHEEGLT
jgi:enoyl-CoA hydratase